MCSVCQGSGNAVTCMVRIRVQRVHSHHGLSIAGLGNPHIGSVGVLDILGETAGRDVLRRTASGEVDRDSRIK